MKTITLTLPVEEAIDTLRLLRAEARCLIENGDVLPDIDVLKRAQNVLSARERIVTELEAIGYIEEMPYEPPQMGLNLTDPDRLQHPAIDEALSQAVTCEEDRTTKMESVAVKHGVPTMVMDAGEVEYDCLDSIPKRDVLGRNY
jgi:hypothetical protein